MTNYTFAELDKWVAKVGKRQDVVFQQAVNYTINGIPVVAGLMRGGSRQKGSIARDTSTLARSMTSTLYGSSALSASGENSHVMVIGSLRAGDAARFAWGGQGAPYARWQHDGTTSMAGTFWIDVAAGKWPSNVRKATAEAKARFP